MPYTKTNQVREIRHKAAEKVAEASAARRLAKYGPNGPTLEQELADLPVGGAGKQRKKLTAKIAAKKTGKSEKSTPPPKAEPKVDLAPTPVEPEKPKKAKKTKK